MTVMIINDVTNKAASCQLPVSYYNCVLFLAVIPPVIMSYLEKGVFLKVSCLWCPPEHIW